MYGLYARSVTEIVLSVDADGTFVRDDMVRKPDPELERHMSDFTGLLWRYVSENRTQWNMEYMVEML